MTEKELLNCKNKNIGFDNDEIYIVADKFLNSLKAVNIKAKFK